MKQILYNLLIVSWLVLFLLAVISTHYFGNNTFPNSPAEWATDIILAIAAFILYKTFDRIKNL